MRLAIRMASQRLALRLVIDVAASHTTLEGTGGIRGKAGKRWK
jgi:hypothetical protein